MAHELDNQQGKVTAIAGKRVLEDGTLNNTAQGSVIAEGAITTNRNWFGYDPVTFTAAQMKSGNNMSISAIESIMLAGTEAAAMHDMTLTAGNNIELLTQESVWVEMSSKGSFGGRKYHERAEQNPTHLVSHYKNITLESTAGNVISRGASLYAGLSNPVETSIRTINEEGALDLAQSTGVVAITAHNTIQLDPEITEEQHKKSGFSFNFSSSGNNTLGYNNQKWNGYAVSQSTSINGDLVLTAQTGDINAHGVSLASEHDIAAIAPQGSIIFDNSVLDKYYQSNGWSVGVQASAGGVVGLVANTNVIGAIGEGKGWSGVKDTIIDSNYTLRTLNSIEGIDSFSDVLHTSSVMNEVGRIRNILNNDAVSNKSQAILGAPSVSLQVGGHSLKEEWTESIASTLEAGGNVYLEAGKDIQLIGGTHISADKNLTILAQENLTIAAAKNTYQQEASNWSVSVGVQFAGTAVPTAGASVSESSAQRTTYDNSVLTAGESLQTYSGNHTTITGANLMAKDIIMDVGGDLTIASVQNTYTSSHYGISLSTTLGNSVAGSGASNSASTSITIGDSEQRMVDNQTSIIGTEKVTITVADTLHNKGALIANATQSEDGILEDQGNLSIQAQKIETEDLQDINNTQNFSFSVSVPDTAVTHQEKVMNANITAGINAAYSAGVTRATVGEGSINTEDTTANSAINRDITNTQEITEKVTLNNSISFSPKDLTQDSIKNKIEELRKMQDIEYTLKQASKAAEEIQHNLNQIADYIDTLSEQEQVDFMIHARAKAMIDYIDSNVLNQTSKQQKQALVTRVSKRIGLDLTTLSNEDLLTRLQNLTSKNFLFASKQTILLNHNDKEELAAIYAMVDVNKDTEKFYNDMTDYYVNALKNSNSFMSTARNWSSMSAVDKRQYVLNELVQPLHNIPNIGPINLKIEFNNTMRSGVLGSYYSGVEKITINEKSDGFTHNLPELTSTLYHEYIHAVQDQYMSTNTFKQKHPAMKTFAEITTTNFDYLYISSRSGLTSNNYATGGTASANANYKLNTIEAVAWQEDQDLLVELKNMMQSHPTTILPPVPVQAPPPPPAPKAPSVSKPTTQGGN